MSAASKRPLCVTLVYGGLGNQLFQIATGIAYSLAQSMDLRLAPLGSSNRPYYWDTLLQQLKDKVVTTIDSSTTAYNASSFSYSPIPRYVSDVRMNGYFQSSKYFPTLRTTLQESLTFSPDTKPQILEKYGDLFTKRHVIVHARRGDYCALSDFHCLQTDEYYAKARDYMVSVVPDPIFILISDDPDFWRTSHVFAGDSCVYFNESELLTFYLMTSLHHFIIANSTFSWWGAYLSEASHVVAPRNWFGPKGPRDTQDLYEPSWVLM